MRAPLLVSALLAPLVLGGPLRAQAEQDEDAYETEESELAAKAQNPVADLISVPFQNNTIFGIGPFNRTANLLNIQPVIPVHLSSSVNLINRAILPVVTAPDVTRPEGTTWGLGDLVYTAFFSPAKPGALI